MGEQMLNEMPSKYAELSNGSSANGFSARGEHQWGESQIGLLVET